MWCNDEFEALIQEAKTTPDQEKRAELYTKAQAIFKAEEPAMTLAHSRVFMPMKKTVLNYKMSPLGNHSFKGVDIQE
jgi:dipeptide transport system substrate-binding protein